MYATFNMTDSKQVEIRLFFNLANRSFYIQIGDCLCPIRDKLVTAIQDREKLNILHAADTKEMQLICNNGKEETDHNSVA